MHKPSAPSDLSPLARRVHGRRRHGRNRAIERASAAREAHGSGAAALKRSAGDATGDPAPPGDGPLASSETATRARTASLTTGDGYPCVCRALLQSDVGPRLTFVFTALAHGRVLATIDELPEVWAIGETVPTARAALLVEVALLLAANPANTIPRAERKRFLRRETVMLAPRRRS